MPTSAALERGRAAFAKDAWSDAYTYLSDADADAPLAPDDLERLAVAAYLIGNDEACVAALTRGHAAFLERGEKRRAAACAYWLVFSLRERGQQPAQASGWLARARRLVEEIAEPCVEQG
jgi:hypothetical protein